MRRISLSLSCAVTFATFVALAGCGGGGGGSVTPASAGLPTPTPTPTLAPSPKPTPTATPVPVVPGTPAAAGSATFTVFTAKVDGQTLVSLAPGGGGPPDSSHSWSVAPGAYVIYPDRSIQLTDTSGSFDASKAAWTIANAERVANNPNTSPALRITVPSSTTPAVPLFTTVLPLNAFDSALTAGGAVPASFSALTVVPSTATMFDDEVRVYTAVGQDSSGGIVNVAPAVKWSLAVPAGCAGPAGSLSINPANASLVTYKPPATGSFANACYDRVVASIPNSNPNTPISATASAVYFSPALAVPIPGKVITGAGTPVANAIVDFYGGSSVASFGDFLALTDAGGAFSRALPPQRQLTPFAANVTTSRTSPSVAAYSVTPTSIAVGPPGGHPAALTLVEGAPFVPYAPVPPAAFNLINSFDVANAALLDIPFGLPNAAGTLPACSIGAYINGQSTIAACGGVVKGGGVYGGYLAGVAADPTSGGNDFTFLEPAGGSGQHVLSVQTNLTAYAAPNGSGADANAPHCSTAAPCVSYARYFNPAGIGSSAPAPLSPANLPAGTVLQIDGAFVTTSASSTYNVNLIRNVYSGSFQIPGQPQRSHAEAFSYPFGATQVTFTDRWYNPLNQQGGNFTFNRAQTATGYTLSGSGTQSYFRAGFAPTVVSYTLTNGVVNLTPGAVGETFATSSVNGSSTVNVNWNWTGLAVIGSAASGTVTNAAGATTATFAVDAAGGVTLTQAGNGGGVQTFVL